jgi:hypothetical protein
MDLRRLRLGEWVAAAGGVVLIGSLFSTWYGTSVSVGDSGLELRVGFSAWELFDLLDVVLVLIGLTAIALAVLQATRDSPAMPVGAGVLTVVLGALGAILVAYRIIDQPGPNELIEVRAGAWVGLAAALAITVGGWESIRNERVRGLPPDPEPELRPAPPRAP